MNPVPRWLERALAIAAVAKPATPARLRPDMVFVHAGRYVAIRIADDAAAEMQARASRFEEAIREPREPWVERVHGFYCGECSTELHRGTALVGHLSFDGPRWYQERFIRAIESAFPRPSWEVSIKTPWTAWAIERDRIVGATVPCVPRPSEVAKERASWMRCTCEDGAA